MLDALFELDKFLKILPIFGSTNVNGVLMMVKGIEQYQAAFRLDLTLRFGSEMKNMPMQALPRLDSITLTDDLGNDYSTMQAIGSGGGMGEWRFNYNSTPAIKPDATRLILEIPRLEFHEPMRGSGMLSPKSALNGPWKIELVLPK